MFFETYDNQFGFKKSLVCRDAVYNAPMQDGGRASCFEQCLVLSSK